MLTSSQVASKIGYTTSNLAALCRQLGIQPERKIVDGRATNFYSPAQLAAIRKRPRRGRPRREKAANQTP